MSPFAGKIANPASPELIYLPQVAEIDTPQPMDVATECLLYDKEKRHNEGETLGSQPSCRKTCRPSLAGQYP